MATTAAPDASLAVRTSSRQLVDRRHAGLLVSVSSVCHYRIASHSTLRPTCPPTPSTPPASRIGDRWSLRIVGALLDGGRTFGELAGTIDGIAPTILTARLRALQAAGVVTATPVRPPPGPDALLPDRGRPPSRRLDRHARRSGARAVTAAPIGRCTARAAPRSRPGRGARRATVPSTTRPATTSSGARPAHRTTGRCLGTWWAPPPSKRSGRATPVRRVRFPSTSAADRPRPRCGGWVAVWSRG